VSFWVSGVFVWVLPLDVMPHIFFGNLDCHRFGDFNLGSSLEQLKQNKNKLQQLKS
jgi:hypothetical protein